MTARGMIRGFVPTVVALELLAKPMRDGRAIDRIDLLLVTESNLLVRPLDRAIARRAATVWAQTGLSLADAVVVATALDCGAVCPAPSRRVADVAAEAPQPGGGCRHTVGL